MNLSVRASICVALGAVLLAGSGRRLEAGHQGFRNGGVGGISIDVEGVVGQPDLDAVKLLLGDLRKQVGKPGEELNLPVEIRMVSLRALEAACRDAMQNNLGQLPDEVRYLAGIQRLQYVFLYPETNDIVLAGPAEGWKVDDRANVVGVTTGRPVLQLEDLLVAFRTVHRARTEGISCSINPTEEGTRRIMAVLDDYTKNRNLTIPALEARMKEAFGPQQVLLTGIDPTTHFARVLVAADYRMKRIAMELEQPPIRGLPSYLDISKGQRVGKASNVNPRWWLTCNYEPLAKSDDGLAWELRGPGVKTMTEDDFVGQDGKAQATGKASPAAQKWADLFTEKYDELSAKEPVFGELRNLMDMSVVAALIARERMLEKIGLDLPMITGEESELTVRKWNAPKTIAPQVSFMKAGSGFIVTASGGVQITSWESASRSVNTPEVSQVRTRASNSRNNAFWWN